MTQFIVLDLYKNQNSIKNGVYDQFLLARLKFYFISFQHSLDL